MSSANTDSYLSAVSEQMQLAATRLEQHEPDRVTTALAPVLHAFFTDRLIAQRRASSRYHRRLPRHLPAAARLRCRQDRRDALRAGIAELDAPLIAAFLDHLEQERGNYGGHP